jgi:hypothetical protein
MWAWPNSFTAGCNRACQRRAAALYAKHGQAAASRRERPGRTDHKLAGNKGIRNVKALLFIAALLASSPVLAQTVQPAHTDQPAQTDRPAQTKSGIIDTLIERADKVRCGVIRNDLPGDALLSGCPEPAK